MKVELAMLKKAVERLEKESRELYVHVKIIDGRFLELQTFNKEEQEILIEIYEPGTLMPKFMKKETL